MPAVIGTTRACFWLPPGGYPIAIYHDANGDHDFNRTLFVPREGYGVSNDVPVSFGRPSFEKRAGHGRPRQPGRPHPDALPMTRFGRNDGPPTRDRARWRSRACADARRAARRCPTPGEGQLRAGVICNPRSHQNLRAEIAHQVPAPDVVLAAPRTHGELAATLTEFAARGIDLLVIDGGDGTVRDVLTAAAEAFGGDIPQVAILPNGKTNALAHDLGIPGDWTLEEALAAAQTGGIRRRAPIVIAREQPTLPPLHGFLVGAGGFVRATELAQRTHRVGAFHDLAVALVVVWSVLKTLFGGPNSGWRAGDPMRIVADGETADRRADLLRVRFDARALPARAASRSGPTRPGFKLLVAPAAARWLAAALLPMLAGARGGWLERAGYRLRDVARGRGDDHRRLHPRRRFLRRRAR